VPKTRPTRRTPDGLWIEGYPDAVKAVVIDGPLVRQLSHLTLHATDLRAALECVTELQAHPQTSTVARESLWESAIVRLFKCFGTSQSRAQLSPTKIFPEGLPRQVFRYFKSLRDKHLVHDENAYTQVIPAAVIGPETSAEHVQDIICSVVTGVTLTEANLSNLRLLIETALQWVEPKADEVRAKIKAELEDEDYPSLITRPQAQFTVPTLEQLHQPRRDSAQRRNRRR